MTTTVDKKVILFNGPPGVGKDTASWAVSGYLSREAPYLNCRKLKMAEPIKKATHAAFDVFHSWDYYDSEKGAKEKEIPSIDFFGATPRAAYIEVATMFRQSHGAEFFGFVMRKRILKAQGCQVVLIDDCGFVDEMEPVIRLVTEKNVMIVELHAQGKDFSSDSRGYIGDELKKKYPKITLRKITNHFGNAEEREIFRVLCQGAAQSFLKLG